jgi:hypothetical protein
VPALVWRADSDGLAFLFMGDIQDRLRRFGRVLAV